MKVLGSQYRRTDGRYWWLLAAFLLLGGVLGTVPVILMLPFQSVTFNNGGEMVVNMLLMGWRFGFLPSILTWAVIFILGLNRSLLGTVITAAVGAATSMLTGLLLYEASLWQAVLAGICGGLSAFVLSLLLPNGVRKSRTSW